MPAPRFVAVRPGRLLVPRRAADHAPRHVEQVRDRYDGREENRPQPLHCLLSVVRRDELTRVEQGVILASVGRSLATNSAAARRRLACVARTG